MSKSVQLIKDHDVKWIDLRFTDTKGTQHHVTMPARDALDEDFFEVGKMFDGSSIAGWKGIEASDMILMPDDSTAVLDPFTEEADPDPGLRHHRTFEHARLRPRPTCDRQACRGAPESPPVSVTPCSSVQSQSSSSSTR